jgi:hypothetical protein
MQPWKGQEQVYEKSFFIRILIKVSEYDPDLIILSVFNKSVILALLIFLFLFERRDNKAFDIDDNDRRVLIWPVL